jgi:CO dehydrogenase/acetyl-CoA synthase epsilon subunit
MDNSIYIGNGILEQIKSFGYSYPNTVTKESVILNNKNEYLEYTPIQSLNGFNIGDIIISKGKKYKIINIVKDADKPFVCKKIKGISIDHKYFDVAEIQKC